MQQRQCLELFITAREPLVLTDGSAEGMGHSTLSYVPGNMLLGALAAVWRRLHPDAAPDGHPAFRALFLDGSVEWGHAYPMFGNRECRPMPLSLRAFKNHPKLDKPGGVAVNVLHQPEQDPETWLRNLHPGAEGTLPKITRHGGDFLEPVSCRQAEIRKVWNMHAALHEKHRAARNGGLFGFSALAPDTVLRSEVYCRTAQAAEELQALARHCADILLGHARSAGYGRAALRWGGMQFREDAQPDGDLEDAQPDGDLTVFLLSDYVSRCSWQNPLENLFRELKEYCDFEEDKTKLFLEHKSIAGFNGLWQLPRSTRRALCKGGVLRLCRVQLKDAERPLPYRLGGGKNEGYGRILLNPLFLEDHLLQAGQDWETKPAETPENLSSGMSAGAADTALITILRRRALRRQAERAALDLLHADNMQAFIAAAAGQSRPGQSQRGNIRQMIALRPPEEWGDAFKKTLQKNAVKRQWRNGAPDPETGAKEFMKDIMLGLLTGKMSPAQGPCLPGGPPGRDEIAAWKELVQKHLLLGILVQWEKRARTDGGRS